MMEHDKRYTCNDMPKLHGCPFCGSENTTIRYGASGYTSNVHYPNETGFVSCLKCGARSLKTRYAKNAVKKWNARKESNAAAPKWISVEERLPEDGQRVLIYDGNAYQWKPCVRCAVFVKGRTNEEIMAEHKTTGILYYRFGDEEGNNKKPYKWRGDAHMTWFGQDVTHWMPLPESPKEEA